MAVTGLASSAVRRRIAGLLIVVWALAMPVFFSYFFDGGAGLDRRSLVHFAPELLPPTPHPGTISAVYFVDADCPCSRGAAAQIDALQRRYGALLQQFLVVPEGREHSSLPASLHTLGAAAARDLRAVVPAFPAVAIWDAAGKLAYFGPIAGGLDCGASGESFVSANLRRLSSGLAPIPVPSDVVGCFCSQPDSLSKTS